MPKRQTKLTTKEEIFIREYLIDYNASRAAVEAGYSKKTGHVYGCKMLKMPHIKEEIQRIKQDRLNKIDSRGQFVIDNLIKISDICMGEEPVKVKNKINGEIVVDEKYIFDPRNAISANEKLGNHYGLFVNKIEHSGSIGSLTKQEEEEFDNLIDGNM